MRSVYVRPMIRVGLLNFISDEGGSGWIDSNMIALIIALGGLLILWATGPSQ
jgi:hypothetical protein